MPRIGITILVACLIIDPSPLYAQQTAKEPQSPVTDHNRTHEEGLDVPGEPSDNSDGSISALAVDNTDHITLTTIQLASSFNFPATKTESFVREQSVTEEVATEKTVVESASLAEDVRWKQLYPAYDAPTPLPLYGKAMFYNPGVMERVLKNRLKTGRIQECSECVGYAAMLRYGDLNRKIWVRLPDGHIDGPLLVIDAADTKHVGMLLDKNWVVDIDYETAQRWKLYNPMDVVIFGDLAALDTTGNLPNEDLQSTNLFTFW